MMCTSAEARYNIADFISKCESYTTWALELIMHMSDLMRSFWLPPLHCNNDLGQQVSTPSPQRKVGLAKEHVEAMSAASGIL